MGLIEVLRPDVVDAPHTTVTLASRRALPDRPVIGLIANGKPLAKELLAVLADEIALRLGREVSLEWLEKPAASYQISASEARVMAVRAHVVISGLGD